MFTTARTRSIAALLLVAMVPAGLGVLPAPTTVARLMGWTLDGRFPCERGHCGCTSAPSCWDHCCCLTPAQQLAWARAEGVTPPSNLLARAAAEPDRLSHCCAGTDDDTKADEATPGCPALGSALECKGVPLWIVFAVVPVLPAPATIVLPPLLPVADCDVIPVASVRPMADVDVPTPPPRLA